MEVEGEQFLRDQESLRERLNSLRVASPLRVVTGVVHPSGVTGMHVPSAADWTLSLPLMAWRLNGDVIRQSTLVLHQLTTLYRVEEIRKSLEAYQLVRVRARVALEPEMGSPYGLIEQFLEPNPKDAALQQLASDLHTPVLRHETPFGELVLDRCYGWFVCKAAWNGPPIEVRLSIDESGSCDASLKIARGLWENQASWERRVRDKIEESLFQIKNDHWLDEGQKPVTAEEFRSLLSIESVTTNPDGTFEFWCNDGDLFWGHSISVAGDLVKGCYRATLEG